MGSGGKRKGAGRKPCFDKKQTVALYIETSIINALGGFESTKEILYSFAKNKNVMYTELLKAFLEWRLTHPYSDFNTRDYDIGEFLKGFNRSDTKSF